MPNSESRNVKIISFNANGIRSAASKGFFDWLAAQHADVTCIQETKSQEAQLTDAKFRPDGHHCFYRDAVTKKGYSGVAIYAKREPDEVLTKLGWKPFDDEGRYIEARFGNLSVVSLYVPSGTSGEERQQFKFVAMKKLRTIFDGWLASGREYVLCGDWNIVRSERDIRNWKSNQKNSGCLPEERAWLNGLIADAHGDGTPAPKHGWLDSFRVVKPEAEEYTWWSNRGGRAPTMSAGVSTTRSRRRASAGVRARVPSRVIRGFPITRLTSWITPNDHGGFGLVPAAPLELFAPRGTAHPVPRVCIGPAVSTGADDVVGAPATGRHRTHHDRHLQPRRTRVFAEVFLVAGGRSLAPARPRSPRPTAQLDAAGAMRRHRRPGVDGVARAGG
jgi:exodeoxyribonuclease-3